MLGLTVGWGVVSRNIWFAKVFFSANGFSQNATVHVRTSFVFHISTSFFLVANSCGSESLTSVVLIWGGVFQSWFL